MNEKDKCEFIDSLEFLLLKYHMETFCQLTLATRISELTPDLLNRVATRLQKAYYDEKKYFNPLVNSDGPSHYDTIEYKNALESLEEQLYYIGTVSMNILNDWHRSAFMQSLRGVAKIQEIDNSTLASLFARVCVKIAKIDELQAKIDKIMVIPKCLDTDLNTDLNTDFLKDLLFKK